MEKKRIADRRGVRVFTRQTGDVREKYRANRKKGQKMLGKPEQKRKVLGTLKKGAQAVFGSGREAPQDKVVYYLTA